ncbi:MAG TPA: hypothetical protein VKU02_24510, partial [Gemmataceae bacterium]|nr:hypothetical protein [Gemmataceae bacterium]
MPASPVDGTILVATLPSQGFTQTDQGSFPTGLVGVNPNLPPPNQSQVSTDALLGSGNYLVFPTYTAETSNGQLYVTDLQYNLGTSNGGNTANTLNDSAKNWRTNQFAGGIVQILDTNGNVLQQRFVTTNTATQLTVDHAWSTIPATGQRYQVYGTGAIIQINPASGAQSVLVAGG